MKDKDKDKDTGREQAWKLDTEIYADKDEDSGLWCAFGNNSEFAYKNAMDKDQAKAYAAELNKNKELDKKYV